MLGQWMAWALVATIAGDPPPIQRPANLVAARAATAGPAPTAPADPPTTPPPRVATDPAPTGPAPTEPAPTSPAAAPSVTSSSPPPSPAGPSAEAGTPSPTPTATAAPEPDPPRAPPPVVPPGAEPEIGTTPEGRSAGALRRTHEDEGPYPHRGVVADVLVGPMGCARGSMCDAGHHDLTTGIRTSGFIGGNIRGWVELGLGGGFGAMRSRATEGTNALVMFGLDPWLLQQALAAQSAGLLSVDLAGLNATKVRVRSTQVGPQLRVHFVPRGRVIAWGGAGLTYNLLRNKYDTPLGPAKMDFHGLAVPIEAAVGVALHEHVALTTQFQYLWTWYGLAVLDHPDQKLAMPMSVLQQAAQLQGIDVAGQLPQFWTVGLGLRGRF